MQKISNSSSTESELEALEIEIIKETQNITKNETACCFNKSEISNNQEFLPELLSNINNQIPMQYLPQNTNSEITRINNNIHILDQNNRLVLKKIKSYREQNDYLIASLILTISILLCCNPILLTVGAFSIPSLTSNSQHTIIICMKICMAIAWILFAIELISCILYLITA